MAKTVVILGGSYVGIATAHKLLKNTLPKIPDLKVILVSSTTHLYWNIAGPRAILPNGFKSDEEIFHPIVPGFTKYPPGSFTFVEGTAKAVDPEKQTTVVATSSGEETLSYDQLVVATGASFAEDLPYKQTGSHKEMLEKLHAMRSKIASAQSIAVVGAGPTGVETAGELGYEYGTKGKKITLICNNKIVLPGLIESVGRSAENELKKLHVNIIHNTRVTSATPKGPQTELTLSSGEKMLIDLYIPAVGVTANTSFLSADLLDERSNLRVDEYLRVKNTKNMWAAGDVTDAQVKQFVYADKQLQHLVKNLEAVLTGNTSGLTQYVKDDKTMQAVPLGRGKGTGQMGSNKLPSVMIWLLKSRNFMTPKLKSYALGTAF